MWKYQWMIFVFLFDAFTVRRKFNFFICQKVTFKFVLEQTAKLTSGETPFCRSSTCLSCFFSVSCGLAPDRPVLLLGPNV